MGKNPHIIGLTGSFGSGCSYISDHILKQNGYYCYSLSDSLKELFYKETNKNPNNVLRHELQDFGDQKRQEHGGVISLTLF